MGKIAKHQETSQTKKIQKGQKPGMVSKHRSPAKKTCFSTSRNVKKKAMIGYESKIPDTQEIKKTFCLKEK